MRYWTTALVGLSATAGAQAPDASDPFCTDLKRVAAAAAESPVFSSLPAHDGGVGAAMLGFRDGCGSGEDGHGRLFICYRQLPPPELSVDALAAHIARCLPTAERQSGAGRDGMFREHVVRFRTLGATIEAAEGGWRTAGGGRVTLLVRPADRAPPRR